MVIFLTFSGNYTTARAAGRSQMVTFEGTLLAYSPHPGIACGVLYVHQVARYRVDRILSGNYPEKEIVVDNPACDGDVFKSTPVGSRVNVIVRVLGKYAIVTMYPGIRSDEHPKKFYVAQRPPMKLESN